MAAKKQQAEAAEWRKRKVEFEKKRAEAGQSDDEDSWLPDWLDGPADTIADYGMAILANPEVWAGAGETALGVVMMVGGGALCITGVGCLAGAPAIVASTGLIVGGAYTATDGIGRLNDGLGQALREAGSTGRTAAGGRNEQQAIDLVKQYPEYGRQLPLTMKDPRWPAEDGWVKMEQVVKDIEIHYVYNTRTRASDDFKFKDRSSE